MKENKEQGRGGLEVRTTLPSHRATAIFMAGAELWRGERDFHNLKTYISMWREPP